MAKPLADEKENTTLEKEIYSLSEELKQKGTKKYPLVHSLWSCAVVMPLACPFPGLRPKVVENNPYWHWDFIKFALPSIMHVCLLVMIESFIIEKISSVWEAEFDCSEEPVAFTAYLCIGCLTLYVLASDVCDGIVTFQWICQIPSKHDDDDGTIRFQKVTETPKQHMEKIKEEIGDQVNMKAHGKYVECKPMFGMSPAYRIYCVLLMVVRIGLTMIVLVLGSGYILSSREPEKQILASLTMVFLVELDDISYALLMPDMVKNKLDDIPAIQVIDDASVIPCVNRFESYWGYLSMGMLVYTATFMVQSWCNKEQMSAAAGFGVPLTLAFLLVVVGVVLHRANRNTKKTDKKTQAATKPSQVSPTPALLSVKDSVSPRYTLR